MGLLGQKTNFKHNPESKLGFGKYNKYRWSDVPEYYLDYLIVNFDDESNARQHALAEVKRRGVDHYKYLDRD